MPDPTMEDADTAQMAPEQSRSGIERTAPDPDPALDHFITEWIDKIEEAEKHWNDKAFKPMRYWTKFARGEQWPMQTADDDRYRANLTLRAINQKVASIYAKNPRVTATQKRKMCYMAWDGSQEMLMEAKAALLAKVNPQLAQQGMQLGQMKPPSMDEQEAILVMKDFQDGLAKKKLYQKMGQTLEILAQYSMDEPIPRFKVQAKQCVRRTTTTGVGYCKVGYQRKMADPSPDLEGRLKDVRDRLQHLERIKADAIDDEIDPDDSQIEELRANMKALQEQQFIILREGIVFTWPRSWSIIPSRETSQLKGFVGAEWIAEKFLFTPNKVQELYGVDVNESFTPYMPDGQQRELRIGDKDKGFSCVYEIYDLVGQVTFTICSGYKGYLVAPKAPDVDLEQFHPYFALTFNDCEDEENPFPPSDVEMLIPMAMEYNRAREQWRVHRIANRPAWFAPEGAFGEDTKGRMVAHVENEVIEHNFGRDVDMEKMIQAKPTQEIDVNLYDTEPLYQDMQRVTGRQAANLGGTAGVTATEVGVAESSRSEGDQSNVDDLDEFLTDIFRAVGKALLLYMDKQTVQKIVGIGAVWPEMSRQQIAEELILDVRAGSSGRPNKQGRLMAVEKGMPLLMQIPDIDPLKLAAMVVETIDDTLDIEDLRKQGQPSITQLNAAQKNLESGGGGGGGYASESQGPQGLQNAPQPAGTGAETQNVNPAAGQTPPPNAGMLQ